MPCVSTEARSQHVKAQLKAGRGRAPYLQFVERILLPSAKPWPHNQVGLFNLWQTGQASCRSSHLPYFRRKGKAAKTSTDGSCRTIRETRLLSEKPQLPGQLVSALDLQAKATV
jgi:hypothetical protein